MRTKNVAMSTGTKNARRKIDGLKSAAIAGREIAKNTRAEKQIDTSITNRSGS